MNATLLDAFLRTAFIATAPKGRLSLRVGQRCVELDELLAAHGVSTWAYVTAFNPGSVPLTAKENSARQRQLERTVRAEPSHPRDRAKRGSASRPAIRAARRRLRRDASGGRAARVQRVPGPLRAWEREGREGEHRRGASVNGDVVSKRCAPRPGAQLSCAGCGFAPTSTRSGLH